MKFGLNTHGDWGAFLERKVAALITFLFLVFTALTLSSYTLKGGLRSSMLTDAIQMVFFGVLLFFHVLLTADFIGSNTDTINLNANFVSKGDNGRAGQGGSIRFYLFRFRDSSSDIFQLSDLSADLSPSRTSSGTGGFYQSLPIKQPRKVFMAGKQSFGHYNCISLSSLTLSGRFFAQLKGDLEGTSCCETSGDTRCTYRSSG